MNNAYAKLLACVGGQEIQKQSVLYMGNVEMANTEIYKGSGNDIKN